MLRLRRVKGPGGDAVSDSATEVAILCWRWKMAAVACLQYSRGPFFAAGTYRWDEKTQSPLPERNLEANAWNLKISAPNRGWTIMQTNGNVNGGRVEIYGTTA